MRKAGAGSSRTRVRSFGGCLTCRTRKVKCDETHPLCGQCLRSGLVCGGYEAKIRFVHYTPGGSAPVDVKQNDGGHSRRILFTGMEFVLYLPQLVTAMVDATCKMNYANNLPKRWSEQPCPARYSSWSIGVK